ncbi:MAG: HpcH/HpaI aldolase/citrate lyase family protein [Alphaproteobacteria bacterium]|nr:HpcH/HpaI aldolase/citrate lyase family protein [Alphaproteobacteria bacterium]MBU6473641.1 HpcH/HpaI aldolase/citrate lyase family protein [Alphaproteobacteria bacterium]MDE2013187.1 HpcH/HpaI aldolase/citrate lyase family protein [Alphaproteobacteria bacterium]MDE2073163.1 HpcH/HpaI aldolase/citrate lyase family protein [Alphaproteobacteria bacterium]MDE2351515.1 HpcH/HpaI aldolase/citrate lyase family protein [Alphaproteobacteria bacterium]
MNPLKLALAERRAQIGLWQSLANPYTAEICADTGYDWLLFDGEHAPNTIQTLLAQLQAVAPYPVEPVARVPVGEAAIIKQYMDIGFRSLLIPMVENAEQAKQLVAATRYPPRGIRGVASAVSRAAGFGTKPGYLASAHEDACLILQIESRAGLEAIEAIAAVDGVDALFIGPSDLAAAMGHLGDPRHDAVQSAITDAIERIAKAGKPSGIFALSPDDARRWLAKGVCFVSVGSDIGLLTRGARDLRGAIR